ncbi:MAG: glycosyltransferase family 4 protein [Nitrospinae bacterium]|nr:glycosyltransferase family 4 protein [Nitrospinota bacterium]
MRRFCFRSYRPAFSGYGYGTHEFVKAFESRGWRFTYQPDALDRARACREEVVIHSGFPHFFRREPGKIHIARVMLESDSLPRLWADVLNAMDEVWVASSFNQKTFARGGVDAKKIFVVPDMVDARFSPVPAKRRGKKFRFLSVFLDLSLRKGWDAMLYAFATRFSKNKNVEWVVQCAPESAKRLQAFIRHLKRQGMDCGNITVRGKTPSIEELAWLYRSANCYVLPTRGEGFGRPYLEAAACGVPVIATGWSGQLDFLNRKNSRLLKYRLVDIPAPAALDCYFLAGQKWAEPSGSDLENALREMLERPAFAPVDTAPFEEANVMRTIADRLEAVGSWEHQRANIPLQTSARSGSNGIYPVVAPMRGARQAEACRHHKATPTPRKFIPQILVYNRRWKARQPSPAAFCAELKTQGKNLAVVGTGRNAQWLSEFLLQNGFSIPFYIDRKEGTFMGKKTYSPSSLPPSATADAAIISTFPASFPEWTELLKGRFKTIPVIFYSHR